MRESLKMASRNYRIMGSSISPKLCKMSFLSPFTQKKHKVFNRQQTHFLKCCFGGDLKLNMHSLTTEPESYRNLLFPRLCFPLRLPASGHRGKEPVSIT